MKTIAIAAALLLAATAAHAGTGTFDVQQGRIYAAVGATTEAAFRPSSSATLTGRLARYSTYTLDGKPICELVVNTSVDLSSPIFPDNPDVLWLALFDRRQFPDLCTPHVLRQGSRVRVSGAQRRRELFGSLEVYVEGSSVEVFRAWQ